MKTMQTKKLNPVQPAAFILLVLALHLAVLHLQQRVPLLAGFPLAAATPTLAVWVLWLIYRSQDLSPRSLLRKLRPDGIPSALLSLLVPVVIFAISHLILRSLALIPPASSLEIHAATAALAFPLLIAGAVLEETGWRGYLQPALTHTAGQLAAAALTGLGWGIWHITYFQHGALFMLGFILFTIGASLFMAFWRKSAPPNLLDAVLFHAAINIGFILFYTEIFTDPTAAIVNGATWIVLGAGFTLLRKER